MNIYSLLLIPMMFMLAGCLTSNTPTYYVLNPVGQLEITKEKLPISIVVELPSTGAGLNTDRITLMKNNGRELDYFASARWNGELDKTVQDFIIESFENSYDIVEVDVTNLYQEADYMIVTKIRDFQAEYEDDSNVPPTIKVTLVCSILKLPNKEHVSRVIKKRELLLEENSMSEIVSGFEILLQETVNDILVEMSHKI